MLFSRLSEILHEIIISSGLKTGCASLIAIFSSRHHGISQTPISNDLATILLGLFIADLNGFLIGRSKWSNLLETRAGLSTTTVVTGTYY